jgi:decaprenyl-phosphate phosphoribosyltransferase
VYLCSNTKEKDRIRRLADLTGTQVLATEFSKPNRRIIESIPDREDKKIVVIGDKRLTDGRFAKNIGAEFIPVSRILHHSDSRSIKATYMLDDSYHAIVSYVRLMRPQQWLKNLFVFAPIFFAGTVFHQGILEKALLAFIAFCTTASAVYIFNDIADRQKDALHHAKRTRPLAAGDVSTGGALVLSLVLLAISVLMLSYIPDAAFALLGYLVLNVAYSFSLKHIAVVDIVLIAVFYVLRILTGGYATATYVSPWIVLCVFFGALVLIIGKRRAEFAHVSRRAVLEGYSKTALDYLLAISATLAIVSYALYTAIGSHSPLVIYSTVFVIVAIFRIVNRLYGDATPEAEYPETLLFKDRPALIAFLLWALYMFGALYI